MTNINLNQEMDLCQGGGVLLSEDSLLILEWRTNKRYRARAKLAKDSGRHRWGSYPKYSKRERCARLDSVFVFFQLSDTQHDSDSKAIHSVDKGDRRPTKRGGSMNPYRHLRTASLAIAFLGRASKAAALIVTLYCALSTIGK